MTHTQKQVLYVTGDGARLHTAAPRHSHFNWSGHACQQCVGSKSMTAMPCTTSSVHCSRPCKAVGGGLLGAWSQAGSSHPTGPAGSLTGWLGVGGGSALGWWWWGRPSNNCSGGSGVHLVARRWDPPRQAPLSAVALCHTHHSAASQQLQPAEAEPGGAHAPALGGGGGEDLAAALPAGARHQSR